MGEFQYGLFYGGFLGFMLGFIGIGIFIGKLSRLVEWASGGAYRREREIREANIKAERWRNRYTAIVEELDEKDSAAAGTRPDGNS